MKILYKTLAYIIIGIVLVSIGAFGTIHWYKKDIIEYFNHQLNKEIKGIVHISDLDLSLFETFPHISLNLKDVQIKDSLAQQTVLSMGQMFLQLNLMKLIDHKIEVRSILFKGCNASIFKDSLGHTNAYVFERRQHLNDSSSRGSKLWVDLKKISFDNVNVTYFDQLLKKNIHLQAVKAKAHLAKDSQNISFHFKGEIFSKGLIFKESKGAFLKDQKFMVDLNFDFDIKQKSCVISHSKIKNKNETYFVTGHLPLNFTPQILYLNIKSTIADYEHSIALLSPHLQKQLSPIKVKGCFDCQVRLKIPIHERVDPRAELSFQLPNNEVSLWNIALEQTNVNGYFCNQQDSLKPADDENSIIKIHAANFRYQGIACSADGAIYNLNKTKIKACLAAQAPLSSLNHFVDSNQLYLHQGVFSISTEYEGSIIEFDSKGIRIPDAKIKGLLNIYNGRFIMKNNKLDFSNIEADLRFDESNVNLNLLKLSLNHNLLQISGKLKNIFPFLLLPDRKTDINLHVYSKLFHVDKLFANLSESPIPAPVFEPKDTSKWLMARIGNIIDNLNLNFDMSLDRVIWNKANGTKVKATLSLNTKSILIHNFFAKPEAGGTIYLKSKYLIRPNNKAKFTMQAKLKGIDASNFFYTFDNFSQSTLTHENLEGLVDANITMSCELHKLYKPQQESMNAEVGLLLRKGRLKNFAPLKNLNRLVFKHRDLMDIQFDEITNQFILKGYELHVQKMKINSSALSLSVEGTYSFQDKTDLSIRIPLSNLKHKHDSNYYHMDENNGINLLLRAKEKNGKMAVSLDPLNKYHKSPQQH